MFVSLESFSENLKQHFFNDKELPMGSISERFASQFLELSSNPKGNSAYKYFSTMLEEKQFVAQDMVCPGVTLASNLEQLSNQLGLSNVHSFKLYFKKNKVSASCKCNGYSYGATSPTISQTITALINQVKKGKPITNQSKL